MSDSERRQELAEAGFTIVPGVLSVAGVKRLRSAARRERVPRSPMGRPESLLRTNPFVARVTSSIVAIVKELAGIRSEAFAAFFLDKSIRENWYLRWHQNLRIPIEPNDRLPPELHPQRESGVWHIIPPQEFLETVVIVRLALDPHDEMNGGLRVLPGSHRHGAMAEADAQQVMEAGVPLTPVLRPGDMLIFKALLLHESPLSETSRRRRTLQLEFAQSALPCGLSFFGLGDIAHSSGSPRLDG
jgi:ectoine hydroxylase-related dioxygenase (phytanoyl-CoA dioxygenase family)